MRYDVNITVRRGRQRGHGQVSIPLRPVPWYGAAVIPYQGTGRSHAEELQAHVTDCGQPGIVRTYDGGMPVDWDTPSTATGSQAPGRIQHLAPGAAIWHSIKPDPTRLLAGELDGQLVGWLGSIPEDAELLLTAWHEPEAKIRNGTLTAAEYMAVQVHVGRLVHDYRFANIHFGPCFMSIWTLLDRDYDVPQILAAGDVQAAAALWDYVGWDPYNHRSEAGDHSHTIADDIAYYLDPLVDFTAERISPDLPLAIGETGYVPDPTNPSRRAAWLAALADYADTQTMLAVCYYDGSIADPPTPWHLRQLPDGSRDEASIKTWAEVYSR